MYREAASEDRSILVVGVNGRVVGLELATGACRWVVDLSEVATRNEDVELAIHDGTVLACTSRGEQLVCIDYRTGAVLGRAPLPGKGRPTMLVDSGRILVGRNGRVQCFDMRGQPLWDQRLEQGLIVGGVALGLPGNVRQSDDTGSR
jgi:outer membrane protein assembly factor BamB